MSKEWNSPWNPFNSMKYLLWKKHLEACAREEYLIPPMVDIDLSPHCNYNCSFCNGYDIIKENKPNLPTSHFLKLADFLKEWKIVSACVSGGGDSMMHPGFCEIMQRLHDNNIKIGLITNGSLFNDSNIPTVARTCRWVGISMDASTSKTYSKIKGVSEKFFDIVCNNIQKLTQEVKDNNYKNSVCFKFLLTPDNYTEILEAVKLAKFLGVEDFHLRPVGYLNITKLEGKQLIYTPEMLKEIDNQMEEAMLLEDSTFHVYGIKHKFNPDFQPKKNFKKCRAIPLLPTFGADGNVHQCFDMRNRKDFIMCKHYPDVTEIARFWNSEKHKEMVRNIDINTCPRCTFSPINEIIEEVIINDKMYKDFL